jgi:hypothetical protein
VNEPFPRLFQLAADRLGEFCTHHWLGMSVVVESEPGRALDPAASAAARFDAFLAFTPRDRPVASAISKGLRQIGRRPTQRRALRVYTEGTDNAGAVEALDRSRYLIVVLSPEGHGDGRRRWHTWRIAVMAGSGAAW